ncbi:MAG: hypothetical protein B6242_12685 [Anaerolineaceae bacterium 4572_78]|nr:MAG: hypothetical protein B6242_12685 [Anaerolineaceae bacterium 4572_78]
MIENHIAKYPKPCFCFCIGFDKINITRQKLTKFLKHGILNQKFIERLNMTDTKKLYQQASMKTVSDLKKMAYSIIHTTALSELTLPEVEEVVELVGRIVPAGNVPGTFFAGPAAVIWGYQNLLTLAGKNPEDAFPEGTWQFYVDYALREDTARHVNETHGFDAVLNEHDIELNPVDRITAWVMTAIHALHRYDDLLENEWRERVYIHLLQVVTQHEPDARRYVQLYRRWERKRPYKRGDDVKSGETYPVYRRRKFDEFLQKAIIYLSDDLNRKWHESIEKTTQEALPAYQKQMSILAYLEPHTYQENRIPISLEETCVGLIYRHEYYLIPTCQPHSHEPADVTTIRNHVASIVNAESRSHAVNLTHVARMKRTEWSRLRKKLSKDTIATLDKLHHAPMPCMLILRLMNGISLKRLDMLVSK